MHAVVPAKSITFGQAAGCSTDGRRGIDHVIDYTREDFTRGSERYDLILGANAYHPVFAYRRALSRDGIFVGAGGGGGVPGMLLGMLLQSSLSLMGRRKLCGFMAKVTTQDLHVLQELLASGTIVPVIDRRYQSRDAADAIRYLEEGHAGGKVVITM